jgi:hypothetical protein
MVRGLCFWPGMSHRHRTSPYRSQRGVSALELVLVIGATCIIAALLVSLYRTHHVRVQVAASIADAAPAQRLVAAAFVREGTPPVDAMAAGIDETAKQIAVGPFVEALEVHNGRIDLRFRGDALAVLAGKTLSLTPFETVDREIVWVCGNEPPDVGLNPLGFSTGTAHAVRVVTAIEDRYLPPICR